MQNNQGVIPVILCGGSGTRLWPLSRSEAPKQFTKIGNETSLFQKAILRHQSNEHYTRPIIITNDAYRFQVAEQALEVGVELGAIILEPASRNTAPAIAAAVTFINKSNPDALVHVLPSDHLIEDNNTYRDALNTASESAKVGYLVTFGVTPNQPATGYGYIKAGKKLATGASEVAQFIEKPELDKAQAMLDEGGYSWNSGMFLFSAKDFMSELGNFQPEITDAVQQAVDKAETDFDFVRLHKTAFEASPSISVDYAVFEVTQKAAVVSAEITWSDIGSWDAFYESRDADYNGNVTTGSATFVGSERNMVLTDRHHVALNGVSGLTVVANDDAILVSAMESSENVKDVVSALKNNPETAILAKEHKTNYRPWGGYTSILNGDRFQVKKLFVKPGKKLSLQKHHHRSEHWVVVSGTAEVTIDDSVMTLSENQSVYIPLGAVHRLANPGKILLEVIEVQSGSYLGEDDIIRIQDDFGRGN